MFEALMDQVTEEIGRGRRIEIRDFGVYEVKVRSGRTAQNPKTLEPVPVPPKCMVRFKPGKSMRQALDDLCKHVSLEESVSRRRGDRVIEWHAFGRGCWGWLDGSR